jgi:hypothetical protein
VANHPVKRKKKAPAIASHINLNMDNIRTLSFPVQTKKNLLEENAVTPNPFFLL